MNVDSPTIVVSKLPVICNCIEYRGDIYIVFPFNFGTTVAWAASDGTFYWFRDEKFRKLLDSYDYGLAKELFEKTYPVKLYVVPKGITTLPIDFEKGVYDDNVLEHLPPKELV